jgi:iron complex outermembrane recepter protein
MAQLRLLKPSIMKFAFLFFPIIAAAQDSLPPLVLTGDKLASTPGELSGNATLLAADLITSLPPSTATYQNLFATIAGGYSGNATAGTFSLRGLNQDNVFGYVGTSSNSLIAALEDGAPLSSQTLRYLPPTLWNLQSVEILRGPQSLSHGPNSLGGAMLFHSQQPDFDWSGNAIAEFSEDNTLRTGIAQDFTLIPDELALRLSYLHQESDGQATNRFLNDDQYGATSRDRYQAQLLWKPAQNPDLRVSLSLIHDRADGSPFATTTSGPGYTFFDRQTSLNTPSRYPVERTAATLNASLLLPNDLELKSTTSLQSFDLGQTFDLDATPFLTWFVNGSNDETSVTQDFSLARKEGDFHWLAGTYYESSKYDVGFSGVGIAPFPFGSPFANRATEDVEIAALYGRFDWEFTDSFHLTGGIRINHEERELTSTAKLGPFPATFSENDSSATELLPQLGVSWQPDAEKTIGLQVSRGYRGGGVSYAPTLGITRPYDPEYSWEAELFARIRPSADLQLSAAVFHSWMEDQQVPMAVPGGFAGVDTLITNAASSRRYGAELEAAWQVHETLGIRASLGYIHTEFRSLTLNGVNRSGQAFPNAPEWTASLGADYRHPSGFFASALYSFADSTYSFASSPALTALESRQLLSARIGYQWENASLYLFGSNLLDDDYALLRADNTATAQPVSGKVAPPRMLGIGCEIRW